MNTPSSCPLSTALISMALLPQPMTWESPISAVCGDRVDKAFTRQYSILVDVARQYSILGYHGCGKTVFYFRILWMWQGSMDIMGVVAYNSWSLRDLMHSLGIVIKKY